MTLLVSTTPPLSGAALVAAVNNAIQSLAGTSPTIASANSIDIGAVDSVVVNISGNVTITQLGGNAALIVGQCKTLNFLGTPILQYSATLFNNPTGADIQVTAGDSCEVQYQGSGNWKIIAYWTVPGRTVLKAPRTYNVRTPAQAISFTNGSANITWNGHGLLVNDPVVISVLPNMKLCTITNANPGVVTMTAHGYAAGQPVRFSSVGYLPPGLLPNTDYYVIATGLAANSFQVSATVGGAGINTSKLTFTASNDGSGNLLLTASGNHGLVAGQIFQVSNSGGGLPGGLSAATNYWVDTTIAPGATTLHVRATPTGTPMAFVSAGTGTQSLEQVGTNGTVGTANTGINAYAAGSNTATHWVRQSGGMPTFTTAGALVSGTVYYVGQVINGNTITLSTTLNNANPLGTVSALATGSPVYSACTGNDANSGLGTARNQAVLTVQQAINLAAALDSAIYDVTIQLADSVYATAGGNTCKSMAGSGAINITGNPSLPHNVVDQVTGGGLVHNYNAILVTSVYRFNGIQFQNTNNAGNAALQFSSCYVEAQNCEWGPGCHQATRPIDGGEFKATGVIWVANNNANFAFGAVGGFVRVQVQTVYVRDTPNYTAIFVSASRLSLVLFNSITFFGAATSGSSVVSSELADLVINAAGNNYIPGNVVPTTSSSGIIV